MTTPGLTPSQRASTGRFPHPPLAGPHNSHVAGAGVGKRMERADMHLSDDEAREVATYIDRGWHGSTGLAESPSEILLIELVQRVMRKGREIVARRTSTIKDA